MKPSARRPIIAITTATLPQRDANGFEKTISRINNRYIALASDFGGIPVLLFSESESSTARTILERVDGLIIIGGQDLDPATYGQQCQVEYASIDGAGRPFKRPLDLKPNRKRDDFEIALYEAAVKLRIPVLGICRGFQLINVAEGGSLFQEIPTSSIDHCASGEGFVHHHAIEIATQSFSYQAMQTKHYFTSSIHHQAIDRLGNNLEKAAWAPDDIIEIIERIDENHFVLGVHGHIEQTRKNLPLYEKLLQGFMKRCFERSEA